MYLVVLGGSFVGTFRSYRGHVVLVTVLPVCYQLSGVTSLREHSVLQYPVSLGHFLVRDLSKSLVLFVTFELTFAHTQSTSSLYFCTLPWVVL